MIYFFSDPHYSHKNYVSGVSNWENKDKCRKFDDINKMNDWLVRSLNNTIKENDEAYCLGDWSFGNIKNALGFREQLNCKKIHLILGNHDNKHGNTINPRIDNETNFYDLFESVDYYKSFYYQKTKFCLFHYPIFSWDQMSLGAIHLFGHCHSMPKDRFFNGGKSMDVGLDGNHYNPYSIDEIFTIMEDLPIRKEGHHDGS